MSAHELGGMTKKLIVEIEPSRMELLKRNGYKLCFAKKVDNFDYNVVWQCLGEDEYYFDNELSWKPMYQLFGAKTYVNSSKIHISTNASDIGPGQTCTLNAFGTMSKAVDGGDKAALNLKNENSKLHVGVSQQVLDADGRPVFSPIYVGESSGVLGEISFAPRESLLVWFEQNVETGMVFSCARSRAMEVELTSTNMARICCDEKGGWGEI